MPDDKEDSGATAQAAPPTYTLSAEQFSLLLKTLTPPAQPAPDAANHASDAIASANNSTAPNVKCPDRPSIDLGCTESYWAFFTNEWKLYKRRARLPNSAAEELRACCSQELRLELFNYIGPSTIDT